MKISNGGMISIENRYMELIFLHSKNKCEKRKKQAAFVTSRLSHFDY